MTMKKIKCVISVTLVGWHGGMVVDVRWAGFSILKIDDLLELSHTIVARVYTVWCENH